jgi:3-deoxy-D-manno-octulosonate 8-phosphate phosphatase (KDO 8-P phosphatase)
MNIYSIAQHIKAFAFDVDGVMTSGALLLTDEGKYLRTFHIRDGYAIRKALDAGYKIVVISGGISEGVEKRLNHLGITDVFMNANLKEPILAQWMQINHITAEQLAYMGDDILDIDSMHLAALKACPRDASPEVKNIANYLSSKNGGDTCVRELIELVLKVQSRW